MGADRTPFKQLSLGGWGEFIANLVRQSEEPAVLVGHSRGGPVIGEAAERAPEAVLGLIYVSAVMIPAGMTTIDAFAEQPTELMDAATMTPDGLGFILDREVARRRFYHRASQADAEAALDRLCPEPLAPNQAPMTVTAERWGSLPRAFIECSDDRAVPLALQRKFQKALSCDPVVTLDSDHSPFLCMPAQLASHLDSIATRFATQRGSRSQTRAI
jgi:pimeloyl-ACP methyl ester carboxylesterase